MPNTTDVQPSLLHSLRLSVRWRLKRFLQHLRVAYLSRKNPVVCIEGVNIPLTKYISDNVREAMFDGGYESAELRTIADNLSGDDLVLEIGTGIGLISTFCAKRIGSDRVYTFEANPELEPYIRDVYDKNSVSPNLEICVLGENEGEATFYVHDDFWSSSVYQRSPQARKVTVTRRSLNDTINRIQPTFLIMDIEGGEYDIFKHINLEGFNKIAVELHTEVLGKDRIDEILSQLAEQGFAIDWRYSDSTPGFKEELFLSRALSQPSV